MRRPLCLLFLLILAACSLYFACVSDRPTDPYLDRDGEVITLTGIVLRKENRVDFSGADVTDLYIRPISGREEVRVQCARQDLTIEIGKTVTVTGTVRCFARATNPGEFDSYEYYLTQGILFTLKNAEIISVTGKENSFRESLYLLREKCSESLRRTLNSSDAAVMRALLLGDRSALDENLKDLYRRNGIIHILAVSGLHISILGLGLKALLERMYIPRKVTVFLCICAMYSYGVMCGMSTSVFRAVLMFVLRLAAPVLKRTYDMLSAVSLCGIMLLLEQPRYAVYSGFLMSFCAVCAIGFLLPLFQDLFFFIPKAVQKTVLPGLCVSFALLPVYMCCYCTFPVISLLLNPLILPLTGLLLPAGVLTLVVGFFSGTVGGVCGLFCHLILGFYEFLCQNTGGLPGAVWYAGAPRVWQVAVFYLILAVTLRMRDKVKKTNLRGKRNTKVMQIYQLFAGKRRVWKYTLMLTIGVIILSYRFPVSFQVTFLDVGQGDCSVIRTGKDCYVLDGGSSSKQNVGQNIILPYLKHEAIKEVDAVILSHDDEDHVSGIRELLDETEKGGLICRQLILPDIVAENKGEAYLELENRARMLQIPVTYLQAGQCWQSGQTKFTCLSPNNEKNTADSNENSLVLLATYNNMQVLFTGDTEGTGLESVKIYLGDIRTQIEAAEIQEVRILKVAHHGSRNNTDKELLDLFTPHAAILSAGEKNRYGHPHKETMELLESVNARTCVTHKTGAIILGIRGENAVISTFLE